MPTNYPAQIDPPENCENDAVHALEQTLGVNPQNTFTNVHARLQAIEYRLIARRAWFMNDYPNPQNAIDAASAEGGGFVYVPWGVTTLTLNPTTHVFLSLPNTVKLVGFGLDKSILKVPDGAGNYKAIITTDGPTSDCLLSDFTIDGNQAGNAPADIEAFAPIRNEFNQITGFSLPRVAVYAVGGTRLMISSLRIIGLDSINHIYATPTDTTISQCHFEQVNTFEHDHSTTYTHAKGQRILYNRFVGTGVYARTAIETHGSDQQVIGNTITNYRKAMNITGVTADPVGTSGVTVMQNHTYDCGGGVLLWSNGYGATPENQKLSDLIIAFNVFGLNKTLWPEASVDTAVCYADGNNKPVVNQLIGPNLVSI